MEELIQIMKRFAASGWNMLARPAQDWLDGTGDKSELITAIAAADRECGRCGCEFDPLYKRALELQELI